MIKGLVLGKFYPLHLGHLALIDFAQKNCDELIVLLCASYKEKIPGAKRLEWIQKSYKNNSKIKPFLLNYSEDELPNTSVSSTEVSKLWAKKIEEIFHRIDIIFSSEPYGEYLSQYLQCKNFPYDIERTGSNISSTQIRENVYDYWDHLAPGTKPFFLKKICIYGAESTGKSTLAAKLATHYQTIFVPEMARDIIERSEEVTQENLKEIAEIHAKKINEMSASANKILFVDTDINITRSYSKFLFHKELITHEWIDVANQFNLYLFLDIDAPYIQDGTRLSQEQRNLLHSFHKNELIEKKVIFEMITGNWEERFIKSVALIDKVLQADDFF